MSKKSNLPKIMVIVVTKDGIEPECYKSILNQDYQGYNVLINAMRPVLLDKDPVKNGVKNVVRNRNYTKKMALASDADYFLWVDSDVAIPANTLSSLIGHNKHIVGGWYKMVNNPKWVAGGWVGNNTFHNYLSPQPSLVRVDMVGLGCVLLSRKSMKRINFRDGMDLKCLDYEGKEKFVGECCSFGADAQEEGLNLYMDGSVICDHLPRKTTGNTYSLIQPKREESHAVHRSANKSPRIARSAKKS